MTIPVGHARLTANINAAAIVPAYWIIPRRCYLHFDGKRPALWTQRISHMFYDYKLGEHRYAYPLALGMFKALREQEEIDFDAVIPIPLSPEKVAAGELHRTLLLAQELGRLLGRVPVRECLSLTEPISKRQMLAAGASRSYFRRRYSQCLRVDNAVSRMLRVLLVDDVITHGETVRAAIDRLHTVNAELKIVVASAGQMITKSAAVDETDFVA